MTLIKKYNDKPEVIANKSVIDHNQLTNREQYGAHPISAIRGLPEKLTKLKDKDNALEEKIETTSSNLSKLTEKVDEVESNANKINIVENAEDGTFTFTNYGATDSKTIQSGYQPDEDTLTLNDSKKMTLKQVHTDTSLDGTGTQANPLLVNIDNTTITKRTDGKLEAISLKTNGGTISGVTVKEELDNLNTDVERLDAHNSIQDNEIYDLQSRTKGMGGYLNSYNFGDFSKLTTEEIQNNLTAYALQQIGITEKTDIFDGTKVINDYDRHLWRLTNTPNSNPVVFEWADLGITQEVSTATDSLLGLVKGSNGDLKGKVDINGEISINGLRESLNDLAEDIALKQDTLTAGESITIQDNVISVDGKIAKYFTGTNIDLYNKIASGEFKLGDFVWLDNVTKDPSITNITDTKLVNGKVLMQIVDGPHDYNHSQLFLNYIFERYYTVILYDVAFKDTVSSYGTTNNHLKTAVGTERFSIYKTHFAMRANPNAISKVALDFYWFVSAWSNLAGTPHNVQLNATTSITENNDHAVTSGAVYKALEKKQNTLTTSQLQAVDSGITNSLVTQISTNTSNISSLSSNKANDNAVVHLTGAETISGIKTFSANTVFTGNLTDGTNSINIGGIVAKANKTTSAEYTLAAANWNNNTYTLSVTGKTANNNADVTYWQGVSDSETQSVKNNMEAIQEANIYQIIDNGTSLTLVCENIPVVDLKIQVEVYE